ncbi:DUF6446 family protein [Chachezhania sediminis]|uniref:DUF6446 family protein n=1 Tax=Chachezhania sediminis TaxID=2599291 RepID=UPI00131BBDF2|nr:DUF6446 family protein [Chachezhania sediminis]
MNGKIFAAIIVLVAAVAGGLLYYMQVYYYYFPLPEESQVMLVARDSGEREAVPVTGFQGIDATSSPLRYRACFTVGEAPQVLADRFETLERHDPRISPGWFDCFDAAEIDALVTEGRAQTFLGGKNVAYGVDRIVVIAEDGRGFAWNDLNHCGDKAYDGTVVGEECPPHD